MKSKHEKWFCLEVWGDYACFTRPEMKVERVSYDVMTPSAARAIFEAIFWKPAIRWHIREIEVLNPIKWFSIRRNEVGATASPMRSEIIADDPNNRLQRAGLILRDVCYRIHAWMEYIPFENRVSTPNAVPDFLAGSYESEEKMTSSDNLQAKVDESPGKYLAIFERRARKGQCFTQPYLGCREFSAFYRLIDEADLQTKAPIDLDKDLGFMLYDMDFTDPKNPQPTFFRAEMKSGKITVPAWDNEEVRK